MWSQTGFASIFGMILGTVYISFLGSKSLEFNLFRACFQVTFYRFLDRNFDAGDSKVEVLAREVLQKSMFA